jgi:hypothetical protein
MNFLLVTTTALGILACGGDDEVTPTGFSKEDSIALANDLASTWNIDLYQEKHDQVVAGQMEVTNTQSNDGWVKVTADSMLWDRNKDGINEAKYPIKYELSKSRFITNYQLDPKGDQADMIDTITFEKKGAGYQLVNRSYQTRLDKTHYYYELIYDLSKKQ